MTDRGILYCAIARGPTILCHNQRGSGNYDAVVESMLPNIPTSMDNKRTFTSDNLTFHSEVKNSIIYICATDTTLRKNRAYAFLEEVANRFSSGSLIVRAGTAAYMELQRDFGSVLATNMNRFSKDEGDNIQQLQSQVNDVRGVMTQNIEKVLQRGENLDHLLDSTTDLENSANTFKKTARQVARKYWWQNLKMKIILAVVIIVIILIILFVILSETGAFKSHSKATTTLSGIISTIKPTTPKVG